MPRSVEVDLVGCVETMWWGWRRHLPAAFGSARTRRRRRSIWACDSLCRCAWQCVRDTNFTTDVCVNLLCNVNLNLCVYESSCVCEHGNVYICGPIVWICEPKLRYQICGTSFSMATIWWGLWSLCMQLMCSYSYLSILNWLVILFAIFICQKPMF
jgi:hypothetical protein